MPMVSDLRLQAATPSNHLWSTFLLRVPAQFVNQAPPGAQQLFLPDFLNMPHLGHVIVFVIIVFAIPGVRTISSRSGKVCCDTWLSACVGISHTASDIDPGEA